MLRPATVQQLADNIATGYWTDSAGLPHNWGPGAAVTYSFGTGFDTASDAIQEQAFSDDLKLWQEVANVSFAQVAVGGEIEIALDQSGQAVTNVTYSYLPGATTARMTSASVSIDPAVFGQPQQIGGYGDLTALHELGHALGLGHPGAYNDSGSSSITYVNDAEFANDTRQNSVMSYFDPTEAPGAAANYDLGGTAVYDQSPMVADIIASRSYMARIRRRDQRPRGERSVQPSAGLGSLSRRSTRRARRVGAASR